MKVYTVVEMIRTVNKDKIIDDEHAFSTREKAEKYLKSRFEKIMDEQNSLCGIMGFTLCDDGWYQIISMDGDAFEGQVSEGIEIDGSDV